MSLLKQDLIKKKQIDEIVRPLNFNINNNKNRKYKLKTI